MKRESIQRINDLLRTTMITSENRSVSMTRSVADNPLREKILSAVRDFDSFSKDNDPYGEHDFGSVEVGGQKFFWKISYYNKDPRRYADAIHGYNHFHLSIMEASEY